MSGLTVVGCVFALVSGLCARLDDAQGAGNCTENCTAKDTNCTTTAPLLAERVRHHGSVTTLSHLDRITVDPVVCHGKPTVRGLRMTVQSILELLASGMTLDEVLADYPYLEREDLLAALEYGAATSGGQQVVAPSQ